MAPREKVEEGKPKKKIPWKHVGKDEKQRIERRKRADRAYRMTRDVAKLLRIPFVP